MGVRVSSSIEIFSQMVRPFGTDIVLDFYCIGELNGISKLPDWENILSDVKATAKVSEFLLYEEDWPVKVTMLTFKMGSMPENVQEFLRRVIKELLRYSPYIFSLFEAAFDITMLDSDWMIDNTYAIGNQESDIHLCLDDSEREKDAWKSEARNFYKRIYTDYPKLKDVR